MKHFAIILASGTGTRIGLDIPKQFYKIYGKTLLEYSVEAFENHSDIDFIIIVSHPDFIEQVSSIVKRNNYKKIIKIIQGGLTRQESSYSGIHAIDCDLANVLIHDAVRPFVNKNIIDRCINALKTHTAVNTAIKSSDTIIETDENNIVKNVPERKYLRKCQTPQCFELNLIKRAHEKAVSDGCINATDDCSLVLKYNLADIFIVEGDNTNIKITYPLDIKIAEEILKSLRKTANYKFPI